MTKKGRMMNLKILSVLLSLSLGLPAYGDELKPRVLKEGTEVSIRENNSLITSYFTVKGETLFLIPRTVVERANAEKELSNKLQLELKDCYLNLNLERQKEHKTKTITKLKWVGVGVAIAGAFYLGSRVAN